MGRPRKQRPPPGPLTAADVIAFIETVCFVPEGKFVGQALRHQDWQKDILRLIYDNPAGTRRAIISMGRKNSKTTLSACILLAHLCGPPARNRPNSELYSAAQSRDQAAIIFSLATKMVRLNPLLAQTVRIQETAIGAQESPLSIIISTQAATDGDLLSILIDDALKGHDPTTLIKLYAAPPELDPFSEEAIRAANPAFATFLNAREVMAMAADASRMPAREAEYRNLVLNQRVEASTPFLAAAA